MYFSGTRVHVSSGRRTKKISHSLITEDTISKVLTSERTEGFLFWRIFLAEINKSYIIKLIINLKQALDVYRTTHELHMVKH